MPKLNVPPVPGASPPQAQTEPALAVAHEGPPVATLAIPRREAIPDLSCIPQMTVDYFAARGYRVTLANNLSSTVMQLSTSERFPLCLQEIPNEAEREEMRKDLRRHGFQIKEEFPVRGDCYIYVQPEEARDEVLRKGRMIWLGQDDPASLDAQLTEFNDLFKELNIPQSKATATDVGRLSDHVAEWGR